MLWEKLKEYYTFTEKSLEGSYGWVWEILTVLFIVIFFNFVFKRLLRYFEAYFKSHQKIWQQSFVSALYTPLSCYIWFFAVTETISFLAEHLFSVIFFPSSKELILKVGLVLAFGWFLIRWKNQVIHLLRQKKRLEDAGMDISHLDMMDKVATVLISILVVMLLLDVTGSNFNTLIAFGGVSGIALAFASQEVIASFFGGLMIYLTDPFAIGDWITLPEKSIEGIVEEIGWYTTKVRTFEKRPIYIPNSIFSKIVVMNPSRMTHAPIKETIKIRYQDVSELKGIITDIRKMLEENQNIDKKAGCNVYFSGFGSYSLDISLSAYTWDTKHSNQIKEEMLFKVIEILKKHRAELASPITRVEPAESFCFLEGPNLTKSEEKA
ncbi:MAG: mechanosensitive ion channel family protein [Parachlamydiaceae bacterium]